MAFGRDTPPEVGAATQFQPGESGNPAGKPKGSKHISTWIQDLLNDGKFEARILDSKIGIKDYKGAPLRAIIEVAIVKAINGDNKWAEWLAKHGYGEKLTLSNDPENPMPGAMIDPVLASDFAEFLKERTRE